MPPNPSRPRKPRQQHYHYFHRCRHKTTNIYFFCAIRKGAAPRGALRASDAGPDGRARKGRAERGGCFSHAKKRLMRKKNRACRRLRYAHEVPTPARRSSTALGDAPGGASPCPHETVSCLVSIPVPQKYLKSLLLLLFCKVYMRFELVADRA